MGYTGLCDTLKAKFLEQLRSVPRPQSHRLNSWDSTDMKPAISAIGPIDNFERGEPTPSASLLIFLAHYPLHSHGRYRSKSRVRDAIRLRTCANDKINGNDDRPQNVLTHNFTKSALQPVPFNPGVAIFWNNNADPWMKQKGSEHPNLKEFGANSLPFSQDSAEVRPAA